MGERWTCLSQEPESRFLVAWASAETEDAVAPKVVAKTRERTADHRGIAWVSDGRACYAEAVRRMYRDAERTGRCGRPRLRPTPGVSLTQVVKKREGGQVVDVVVRQVLGEPVGEDQWTVHVERRNGVLRDRLACLTRKTHAFAKREETWKAAVGLGVFEGNWIHPLRALREWAPAGRRRYRQRTPAMDIGLTDHVWSWQEFLTTPHHHFSRQ